MIAVPHVDALEEEEPLQMSGEDYLAFEEAAETKHEYDFGWVYAMAGASEEHNVISLNIAAELRAQLRGKPCRAYMADLKCKTAVAKSTNYYYPDVMVACDPTDKERYWRERPTVVFEVLSRSTRRLDEHKFLTYQQNPALRFYLLVSQEKMFVRVMRRAGEEWLYEELRSSSDVLKLDAIGCELSLAQIYEGVTFAGPSR
jgi:Uma2 family endonuclease